MGFSLVRSRHEQGQLVFYDSSYRHRWLDAIGPNVVKFVDDFAACLPDTSWNSTAVEAGTSDSIISVYNSEGGIALFAPAENDNDAIQIQSVNEGFKLTDSDPCYFGARWAYTGAAAAGSFEVFIGLSNQDTTLVTGGTSCVGFNVTAGSNQIGFYCAKANSGTTQNILTSMTADVFHVTEFYWNGGSTLYCWIDGAAGTSHTTQIPTAQSMAVSISVTNNGADHATTNTNGLLVDWVRVIQLLASR